MPSRYRSIRRTTSTIIARLDLEFAVELFLYHSLHGSRKANSPRQNNAIPSVQNSGTVRSRAMRSISHCRDHAIGYIAGIMLRMLGSSSSFDHGIVYGNRSDHDKTPNLHHECRGSLSALRRES